MSFPFYPNHEHGCPNVGHCPHLGGAALGTLVLLANDTRESREYLFRTIDAERATISRLVKELLGITFTPGALIGFEKFLNELAKPIVEDIAKKLASSDGAVHADETYSLLDGKRAYFWVHATTRYVHFSFGTTRSGKVSRVVLGNDFTGTLVTDCDSAYFASVAGAKQKCLAHLARTARDWQKLTKAGSTDFEFFNAVKQFVKRGCDFHRERGKGLLNAAQQAAEKKWLNDEQARLESWVLTHNKALT